MSASRQRSAPLKPGRRRRFWRILLGVLALLFLIGSALVLAFRAYHFHVADQRVQEAETKLDQEDPRWRWEDVLADRALVPDEENSARPILAAAQLIPERWPAKAAVPAKQSGRSLGPEELKDLGQRLTDTPPNHRLDRKLAADLDAELKALAPALAAAKPVTRLPQGRYEVAWSRDYLTTPLDHVQRARTVAYLFMLQAVLRADEGNLNQALASARGALNTGRSLGDEPTFTSLLVRMGCGGTSLHSLQRVLGQGEPLLQELEDVQEELRREMEQSEPLLRHGFRAERAAFFAVAGRFASGEFGLRHLEGLSNSGPHEETWWSSFPSWLCLRPVARYNQAAILELMTEVVELSRLPSHEQAEPFAEFTARVKQLKASSPHLVLTMLFLPAPDKLATAFHRYRAGLECAEVAVAAERFRREHGRWPESLDQLVPRYLDRVPDDPFDGEPLRYRPTADGVEIFSVGPDHVEDPDVLEPCGSPPGTGIGFRLWDVKQRRR